MNRAITASFVRLIGNNGDQISEKIAVSEALLIAAKENMDLVQFGDDQTPTCRIMNYGAFNFKKKKNLKSQQRPAKIKEVKFRPVTDEGDFQVKLRNLKSFLEKGNKVKVTLRFRGREIAHQDLAHNLFKRVIEQIEGLGQVDSEAKLEGKQMTMMLSPKSAKKN